jgi:hypothetical protein
MSDYIDANLNVKQRQEAEQHIGECRECRAKLFDLKGILGELKTLPTVKTLRAENIRKAGSSASFRIILVPFRLWRP